MKNNTTSIRNFLYKRFFKLFSLIIIINFSLVIVIGFYEVKSINTIYTNGLYKALEQDENEILNELVLREFLNKKILKEHLELIRERLQVDSILVTTNKINEQVGKITPEWLDFLNLSKPIAIPLKGSYSEKQGTLFVYYSNSINKLIFSHILWMMFIMFTSSIVLSSIVFFKIFRETNKILISPLHRLVLALNKDDMEELSIWPKNSLILDELLKFKVAQENYIRAKIEHVAVISELTARLAHDIRSPVMSMSSLLEELSTEISDKKFQLLEQSVQSIRDIANNLLIRYKDSQKSIEGSQSKTIVDDGNQERYLLLFSLIDSIFSQKRYEWQNNPCELIMNIQPEAKILWILAAPNEIRRSLSNLLNNAYEALENKRQIYLNLFFMNNQLVCSIKDTGKGIDPQKINYVLNGTSLKRSGHGLGLSRAKKMMEAHNGSLLLTSAIGVGTEVTLFFPLAEKPKWFPSEIILSSKKLIAVLDDDPSVHNLWRNKAYPLNLHHFTHIENFMNWLTENKAEKENMIFLMDYELNQDSSTINGLDLLEELNPKNMGYLMTSHAEEYDIQKRCEAKEIWLIPKVLFEYIPIHENEQ